MYRISILCLLVSLCSAMAHAQESEALTPEIPRSKYALGFDLAPILSWSGDMPMMGTLLHGVDKADASGLGYMTGISGRVPRGETWGMQMTLRYLRQHVTASLDATVMTQVQVDPNDPAEPPVTSVPVRIESSADFEVLQLAVAYEQEFARVGATGLSIPVGPSVSFVAATDRRETIDLDAGVQGRFFNPSGMPLENDARTMILYDGDPKPALPVRSGLLGAIQAESPISSNLSIVSSVEYEYEIGGEIGTTRHTHVNSLITRAALQWSFR